jgi:hypothetical protein
MTLAGIGQPGGPLTTSVVVASGIRATTVGVTRIGVTWSAAPGVRCPKSLTRLRVRKWYATASPLE